MHIKTPTTPRKQITSIWCKPETKTVLRQVKAKLTLGAGNPVNDDATILFLCKFWEDNQ